MKNGPYWEKRVPGVSSGEITRENVPRRFTNEHKTAFKSSPYNVHDIHMRPYEQRFVLKMPAAQPGDSEGMQKLKKKYGGQSIDDFLPKLSEEELTLWWQTYVKEMQQRQGRSLEHRYKPSVLWAPSRAIGNGKLAFQLGRDRRPVPPVHPRVRGTDTRDPCR